MVMPGDNLYRLSQSYGITVSELQKANCMGGSDLIRVGQIIYVPWWAPHTPTPTLIYPATDTPFVIPTDTPLVTPSETPTEPTPSDTPIPSDTPTLVPTDTPIILPTDTPLPIVNP
jgi:LysM repeat protein